ncbi:TetR/AcrR family transcriptional regulator C-terminal domain-containing protein [Streptomyces sp. STR69]|uniref:TetR/AcrR family transcriptional regulator C-terminal domain-containing protein n=1 Tax=Streptomyces sp. STR69 TaxID=1796942 RepID=UPI0021C81B2E|nr:TetR/AcrR family transcriptional regulator C-terminal domain-containing protein [Streptomyces sp. STR69]
MAQRLTRRGPLTREEIVSRALELAEAEGVEKLSLHKIATAVGVRTMSLYNHVDDKTDVLDAMADVILKGIVIPDVDGMSWQDGLRGLARAFRTAALRYPHSATLVLTRDLKASAAMPVIETALRVLNRAGLEGAAAVHVLRAFIAFLIGTLAREVGSAPTYAGAIPEVVADRERDLARSGLPAMAAVAGELAVCDHEAEMEFGLELILDGVRRRVTPAG